MNPQKSLIVWKPDATPGTTGRDNPPVCQSSGASIISDKVRAQGTAVQGYKTLKGTSTVK